MREIAAYELVAALGWGGLIPVTIEWFGPFGGGSLQEWLFDADPGERGIEIYEPQGRVRAAVLDYLIANMDRLDENYLGFAEDLQLIDHGAAFPGRRWVSRGTSVVSPFVAAYLNTSLREDVLADVRRLDLESSAVKLRAVGLGIYEAEGVLARLNEIQLHGTISGDAWREQRRPPGTGQRTSSRSRGSLQTMTA